MSMPDKREFDGEFEGLEPGIHTLIGGGLLNYCGLNHLYEDYGIPERQEEIDQKIAAEGKI